MKLSSVDYYLDWPVSSQTEHEVPPTDGERIIMSFNIRKAKKTQLTTDDYDKVTSFIMNDQ